MNTNDHIDMMWDIKVSSFDTVWQSWLSVYVQHLRQKFDRNGEKPGNFAYKSSYLFDSR